MSVCQKFACFYFEDGADCQTVADEAYQFSPQIYLLSPHAVIIEYGRSFSLFSEEDFLSRAKLMLEAFSKNVRIGLAENQLFSFIKAKYAIQSFLEAPPIALIDICEPHGKNQAAIRAALGMVKTLKKLQIRNLGDFKNIPISHFPSRFGELGKDLKLRVNGEALPFFEKANPPVAFRAKEELSSSYNGSLGELISAVEGILKNQLFPPLRKIGAKLEEVKITFGLERNSRYPESSREFEVKFVEPQFRAEDTVRNIWTCLEVGLQKKPLHFSTPILFIEVQITKWIIDIDEQESMFNKERMREERHNLLLTRQKIRFGETNIFKARVVEDWRHEHAWEKHTDLKTKPQKIENPDELPDRLINRYEVAYPVQISTDRKRITRGYRSAEIVFWEPYVGITESHWHENEIGEVKETCQRIGSRIHLKNKSILDIFQDAKGHYFLIGSSG